MPDATVTTTPAAPATPATPNTPKQTANNIARAIHDKVSGKSAAPSPTPPKANDTKPTDTGATQPDPNAGKEKYVVDGKEMWLTPEQARAYVQKGLAFDRTADQLGILQQEQQKFMHALINDPGRVLSNLAQHHKVPIQTLVQRVLSGSASDEVKEAVGQWFYDNAVAPMKMTPEELKAAANEKKLTEYEKQEKARQENAVRQENQARLAQATAELKGFISEAMKQSGLPDNNTPLGAEMARQVADVMRVARFQRQAVTPTQAIEHVKTKIRAIQNAYYETLDEEADRKSVV